MSFFQFIKEILIKYPSRVIANMFAAAVVSMLGVTSLLMLAPVIDLYLHHEGAQQSTITVKVLALFHAIGLPVSLSSMMISFMVMVLVTSAVQVFGYWLIFKTRQEIIRGLMMGTFEDIFGARWLFFSSSEHGKIYNTVNKELFEIGGGIIAIGLIFSCSMQCLVLAVVPLMISWQVTLLCLLAGGVISVGFFSLSRYMYYLGKMNTQANNKFIGAVYESISSVKLVLGYGNAGSTLDRFRDIFEDSSRWAILIQTVGQCLATAYRPVGVVVVIIALMSSKYFNVPVAEIATLLLALLQIINLMGQVLAQKSVISQLIPGYEQVNSIRAAARELRQRTGSEKFTLFQKEIAVEDLSFAYPGRNAALERITLRIGKGETVAFVGRSGAGKTTLVDILMGLHEPTGGRVLIDGIPLEKYDIISYRKRLGYVPQDSALFNMSIKDNLLWALPTASEAEIKEACRMAYADEFIDSLPQGYDTIVGERGTRLSGGQVQRMALARAFLRKPEIFFLDEATSSLDSHSETLIQKAIEAIAGRTTVVVIAHRLATIKQADTIYVLDKGIMVQKGSYQELFSQDGCFHDLAKYQELELK